MFQGAPGIEQFLGPLQREAGDQQLAAAPAGSLNVFVPLFLSWTPILANPVAVGRFDENVVAVPDIGGIFDDGYVPLTQVAGENDLGFCAGPVLEEQFDDG